MDAGLERTVEPSAAARFAAFVQERRLFIEAALLVLAIAILFVSVLPNLANHPTLTDDEAWVMSSAYKLAEEGVFGSDMFAGFFHADERYFFNMPAHHFMIAGAFKLLGAGIVEARLVGLVYGIATLVLAYLIARKLYGVAAGALTLGLLLFLRLNIGFDTGLPLPELAANMRYDLAPVPFILGGVYLLLGGSTFRRAAGAGALLGFAVLLQFYGAFMLPIAAAFLASESLPRKQRAKLIGVLAGAAALVALPYALFIASAPDDFAGQAGTIDRRADFHQPSFYIDNLTREADRFIRPLAFKEVPRGADHALVDPQWLSLQETVTRRPSAKAAVLLGLPLALGVMALRTVRERSRGDRLMLLCLGGLVAQYALFESTKFYIYWMPVVPFLCIGIAAFATSVLRPPSRGVLHLAAAAATVLVLTVFLGEGSVARIGGIRAADGAMNYEKVSREIHQHVPPGSRVVGSTSLWWGLRDMDFRSYFLFFYLTRPDTGESRMTISEFLDDFDAEYLVLTRLAMGELETYLVPEDRRNWQSYMEHHGTLVARIHGPVVIKGYGFIDIWKFD
jgi:4-amino-4-deoxy-L-arabinose transferase-like glycosyltransferase